MNQESWSRKYYGGLTDWEHDANDLWFKQSLELLTDTGVLIVPNLNIAFNKKGDPLPEKAIP